MMALGFLAFGAGLVLVFCGIRGEDPRTVIVDAITGKRAKATNPYAGTHGALGEITADQYR